MSLKYSLYPDKTDKNRTSLNGLWEFVVGEPSDSWLKGKGVSYGTVPVPVPYWYQGFGSKNQTVCFRKKFSLSIRSGKIEVSHQKDEHSVETDEIEVRGRNIVVVFYGVDEGVSGKPAEVFVNGKKVAVHSGWTQAFFVDITPFVFDGENVIAVKITDYPKSNGIWKDVELVSSFRPETALVSDVVSKRIDFPDEVEDGIFYEVFVRNYPPNGTIKSVLEDLDRLSRLGVKVIWLMPIHPIGIEKRKGKDGCPYSVKNYYEVDPNIGTVKDLKELVSSAHSKGMKVIIDVVLNHSAWDNPLRKEHPEFYKPPERAFAPRAGWSDVIDFDYSNPELRDFMAEMLTFWIRETDIDGFRADVAELIPASFWKQAFEKVKSVKKSLVLLAEGDKPFLYDAGFNTIYDWGFRKIVERASEYSWNPDDFIFYEKSFKYRTPRNSRRILFLENHDMERASSVFDKSVIKTAGILRYFLDNFPLIYNGEEYGITRRPDLFNIDPIDFSAGSEEMMSFYVELAGLRREVSRNKTELIGSLGGLLVVERGDFVCAVNLGREELNLRWVDAVGEGEVILASEEVDIESRVPPISAVVVRR